MIQLGSFDSLTPDRMIDEVENALQCRMSGLAAPLPSYINRVYQFQTMSGTDIIAKFYRPGRWDYAAIADEHQFVLDCAAEEIPVIAPLQLANGRTIGTTAEGNFFALYPKRFGREFEINSEDEWRRLGRVIARMHLVGAERDAPHRLRLHPELSTANDIRILLEGNFIPRECRQDFIDITDAILRELKGLFDDIEYIRLHGDCHRANILERPEEGLMIIDFDDMLIGPPIQDLWLLLPGYANDCRSEVALLLDGYHDMREFDEWTIQLIEPLRIMRLIYFLGWCARQSGDLQFRHNFPDWGSLSFWRREINDLSSQLRRIKEEQRNHATPTVSIMTDSYPAWDDR